MKLPNLNIFKPKKPLGLGYHELPHIGDLEKDFFVTVGCSHTKGSGISYENTWSNLLGKSLKMEHLNLGFSGSSLEYQYNIILKVKKFLPQTKFILWMHTWPIKSHRPLSSIIGDKLARINCDSLWEDKKTWTKIQNYVNFVKDDKVLMTNCWNYHDKIKLLLKYEICIKNKKYFYNKNKPMDDAKDNVHSGAKSHNKLAQEWHDHILQYFPQWISNK